MHTALICPHPDALAAERTRTRVGAKSVTKNLAISLLQSLALGPLAGLGGGGVFGGQSQTAIVSEDLPSLDDELPVQVCVCTQGYC